MIIYTITVGSIYLIFYSVIGFFAIIYYKKTVFSIHYDKTIRINNNMILLYYVIDGLSTHECVGYFGPNNDILGKRFVAKTRP